MVLSSPLKLTSSSCPSASPEFEGRGSEVLNLELARTIERYLNSNSTLDLRYILSFLLLLNLYRALCLVPARHCWVIYVDALVLDSTGNLFDVLSIATRAALLNTEYASLCPLFSYSNFQDACSYCRGRRRVGRF